MAANNLAAYNLAATNLAVTTFLAELQLEVVSHRATQQRERATKYKGLGAGRGGAGGEVP